MSTSFESALATFVTGCKAISAAYYTKHYPNIAAMENAKPWEVKSGPSYAKVVHAGSAYCFVCKKTGDVLKAASWKAPAKHARGNIFDESNGLKFIGPYGPAYLR